MKVKLEETKFDKLIFYSQEITITGLTLILGASGIGKTTALKQLVRNYDCGFVSQDPDNQIVCDKVWHELAFGLENIGMPSNKIRARVAEVATYLGISSMINKDISELSGGQKQKVCLAAILCMAPKFIILDEPTSMLDPISAREFWNLVLRLHNDNNITFLITEHNSIYIQRYCDLIYELRDGYFKEFSVESQVKPKLHKKQEYQEELVLRDLRKSYGQNLVLNIPKLSLSKGINCFVGPNGVGKSTLLHLLTGSYKEKKLIKNSVLMPQDVKILFSKDVVRDELRDVENIPEELKGLLDSHPLDLSGGEQHILGVVLTLQKEASFYCFDEPTKGMDRITKDKISKLIVDSRKNCIVVSHDLDMVSKIASKVFFLFNREIASEGTPYEVFGDNLFYKPEGIIWN